MKAQRFTPAVARIGHARVLACLLSAAALLPLSGCGGGGGGGGDNNAASPAPTSPSSPTTSSNSSTTCTAAQAAAPATSSTTSPTAAQSMPASAPPVDHLIVKLATVTAAHALSAGGDDATRLAAVIQRVSAQWTTQAGPSGSAHAYASAQPQPQPLAAVERTMSGGATVLKLGQPLAQADASALAQVFASDSDIEYAEPDQRMRISNVPTDPDYNQQWNLSDPTAGIDAPAAWSITQGSPNVVTAVLDTGYRPHPDIVNNLVSGYNFISNVNTSNNGETRGPDATDPGDWVTQQELDNSSGPYYHCQSAPSDSSWHGTRVAGVIGAIANNGVGIAGISWLGKIQPVRVLGKCGGATSDIADAMRWAAGIAVTGVPTNATPAKIINLSLAGPGACSQTFQQAINDVTALGVTVIVAAGNEGVNATQDQPANCQGVIAVGATDTTGMRASFSNYGTGVALSAPGVNILSTSNTGTTTPLADGYGLADGTSLAAPQVSGVVALMLAMKGNLTPAQIQQKLQGGARASKLAAGTPCTSAPAGSGILDAAAAVNAAMQ
ncbi:S8 family peptidase [Burkholderia guangdongensis]|uniref:S8 family peptidase n=1 Tax=Burkholderia guangdongensis TaxID=1792500 RepID=UPI0015C71677|nr:S8 family peptidase [Burkholderia guangdongensis]